jgi:hypothetical protein
MNDMFSWLLAGHLAGDFLFQTRWMAERKTTCLSALAAHSAVYALAVWIASLPAMGLSPLCVFLVFASHAALDRRGLVLWWRTHITKSDSEWLTIMTDQSLHVVVLALACLLERSI